MKKTKKIVSLLLTLCMLLSAIPITVFTASAVGGFKVRTMNMKDHNGALINVVANVYGTDSSNPIQTLTITNGSCSLVQLSGDYTPGTQYSFYLTYTDSDNWEYTSQTSNVTARSSSQNVVFNGGNSGTWVQKFTVTNGTVADDATVNGGYIGIGNGLCKQNDTVTVTAYPNEGYELDTLKYNDGSDHTLTATDNVATFVMPASNVTVSATFKAESPVVAQPTAENGYKFDLGTSAEDYTYTWYKAPTKVYLTENDIDVYSGSVSGDTFTSTETGCLELEHSYGTIYFETDESLSEWSVDLAQDDGVQYTNSSYLYLEGSSGEQFTTKIYYYTTEKSYLTEADKDNLYTISKGSVSNNVFQSEASSESSTEINITLTDVATEKYYFQQNPKSTPTTYYYNGNNTDTTGANLILGKNIVLTTTSVYAYLSVNIFYYTYYGTTNQLSTNQQLDGEYYCEAVNNDDASIVYKSDKVAMTTYAVTNATTDANGTAELDVDYAPAGETVTVTTTPNSGYELDTLKYNDGTDHTLTATDNVATFAMPASNVTVSATFKAVVTDPEFYAVYNTAAEGTNVAYTLSFYYDTNKSSHTGTTVTVYDNLPTTANDSDSWGYNAKRYNIKNIVIDSSVKNYTGLTSTAYMFYNMAMVGNTTGFEYLNVSNVTNMAYMFSYFGGSNTSFNSVLNVSNWETGKVTNMSCMFQSYAQTSTSFNAVPDVSGWDTSKVEDMRSMFSYFANQSTAITDVPNVLKWKTDSVINMSSMFYNYGYANTSFNAVPNVSGWDTSKVEDMSYMFYGYANKSTTFNDVPNVLEWNTSSVINMSHMFRSYAFNSKSITVVPDVSKWNTGKVTNMSYMFQSYAYKSTSFNAVPNVLEWNTSSVTNMSYMFYYYAYNSTSITVVPDVSKWNTSNVTTMQTMFGFYGYANTSFNAVPDVSKWNTGKVANMAYMFQSYACTSTTTLQPLDLSGWDISALTNTTKMFNYYATKNPTDNRPVVYGADWNIKKASGVTATDMFKDSTLKGTTTGNWDSADTDETTGCFTAKVVSYTITNATTETDKATNNGYIVIDKTTAQKGETVTVTVTPNTNYVIGSLKYNDGITNYDISKNAEGKYTFTMSDKDVTVTAIFMQPWADDATPANNQIFYTATGRINNIPSMVDDFGPIIATYDETTQKGILTFSKEITEIPNNALLSNDKLTSIILPSSVTTIGDGAFFYDESLESVSMPGVTSIKDNAFNDCDALTNVYMPEVITIGEDVLAECDSLTSISMPKVESIGRASLSQCANLTTVIMPKVTTVDSFVFYSTDLTYTYAPSSVATTLAGFSLYSVATTATNGTATIDDFEVVADCVTYCKSGVTLTVTATPNEGYELNEISVNGTKIEGNTFTMLDEAVTVSATFKEKASATKSTEFNSSTGVTGSTEAIEAYAKTQEVSADTTYALTVDKIEPTSLSDSQQAIKDMAGSRTVTFYDATFTKTVAGGTPEKIEDTNGVLLSFTITYDMSDRCDLAVYRYHGQEATPLTKLAIGEKPTDNSYSVSGTGKETKITIYTSYFSDWAAASSKIPAEVENAKYYTSLTLNDSITVNFKIKNTTDIDMTKLEILVNDSKVNATLSEGVVYATLASKSAKEMGDTFTVEVVYDGVTVKEQFTYSVAQYCYNIIDNSSKYSTELYNLCAATLNYGTAAQTYFDYNTANPVNAQLVNKTVDTTGLASVEDEKVNVNDVYTDAKATLELGANTTIKFTITSTTALTEDNVVIITEENEKLSKEQFTVENGTEANTYVVSVSNIANDKLSRYYTVSVDGVDTDAFSITFCPYNYCNLVLEQYPEDTNLIALTNSIYAYGQAAKAYSATKA